MVDLSSPALQAKIKAPNPKSVKLCYGFWVDWLTDPGNPQWKCEITCDGKSLVREPFVIGPFAGGCPLLVGRFNPQHYTPWGRGPAITALPDMRVHATLDELVLQGMDQALSNTLIYADDGYLNLEDGLQIGKAHAAGRGFTRDQVFEMNRGINMDVGFFSQDRIEARLRSCFYQDGPRQRGDTPPTAAQWVDERRRVQQRLGKPSLPLWTELFKPLIQRFEYLGVQQGKLDQQITVDGTVISIAPISPLQKASNAEKAMIARANMEIIGQFAGDQMGEVFDFRATMKNVIAATADDLTVLREKEAQPPATQGPPA